MQAAQGPGGPPVSSYLSVNEEDFQTVLAKMRAAKPGLTRRQQEMLAARYDLEDRPVAGATMSKGKAVQGGGRLKLPAGSGVGAPRRLAPGGHRGQGDITPGP